MKKKKSLLIVIGTLLLIAVSISISYAYYVSTATQQGENVVKTDCFALSLIDDGQIVLRDTFPFRDSVVDTEIKPYHFKIKNVCTLPASYQVNLEILRDSNLDIEYLNYKLDNGAITSLTAASDEEATLIEASSAKLMAVGNLLAGEEVEYDLRIWLKEAVTTSDPVQNKIFQSKITVISTLNKSIIKNIILHPNGGRLSNEMFTAFVGFSYKNLPTPVKDDEQFLGWYSDSSFNNVVTNETIVDNNVTDLYAKYGNPYEIVSGDLDTIGSVIKIADEEFYVIGQEDSTHVKLLSKWNLNVGDNPKGSATNLQDSDVRGNVTDGTTYGNVAYSNTNYWYDGSTLKIEYGSTYPAYVYDNNTSIKTYVDNYVTYLNNQGVNVSGRLISHEELVSLGCNTSSSVCSSAPEWVYQTSYWTGSADESGTDIWEVSSNGNFSYNTYNINLNYGVRPVIILAK